MAKDWKALQDLAASIEQLLAPQGAVVKISDRTLIDLHSLKHRRPEVDVSIKFQVGSVPMNKLADNPQIAPKLAEVGALPYSGTTETGIGRCLYGVLLPDRVPSGSEVEGFWLNALDTRHQSIEIHDFARGFVEGALGVWENVRGKF